MENFKVNYSNKKGVSELEFSGQLNINNIEKITENLKANLKTGKSLHIKTKDIENLDLTFIQLVYSLIKQRKNEGIEVNTSINVPKELKQLIINSGFSGFIM
jgi:ABC-type transporter Mla MlaB component